MKVHDSEWGQGHMQKALTKPFHQLGLYKLKVNQTGANRYAVFYLKLLYN